MSHLSKEISLQSILPKAKKTPKKPVKTQGGDEHFKKELVSLDKKELSSTENQALNEQIAKVKKGGKEPTKELSNKESKALDDSQGKELLNSFMQILSLLEMLQSDTKDIKLNKFSELLKQSELKPLELDGLKDAKDIKQLLDFAKKLDLNIKKISFEQLLGKDEFKAAFPKLDQAGFFKPLQSLPKLALKETKLVNKDEGKKQTPLTKLLDELSKPGTKKKEAKAYEELKVELKTEDKTKLKQSDKEILEDVEIQTPKKSESKKPKESKKVDFTQEFLSENKSEVKESKKEILDTKENIKVQNPKSQGLQEKQILNDSVKTASPQETKEINQPVKTDKIIDEALKMGEKLGEKITDKITENTNLPKREIKHKVKKEELKLNKEVKKDLLKELLGMDNKKLEAKTEGKTEVKSTEEQPADLAPKENLQRNTMSTFTLKNLDNTAKQPAIKQTLNHFASDLYEAAKEHKGPISKLSINLNPHNLGEVEVTLIQRGNNLHVSFQSNTNTMQLFLANQAEFKASLVNMGFGELQMSFSEKKEGGESAKQDSQKNSKEKEDEGQEGSLELEIAKYF